MSSPSELEVQKTTLERLCMRFKFPLPFLEGTLEPSPWAKAGHGSFSTRDAGQKILAIGIHVLVGSNKRTLLNKCVQMDSTNTSMGGTMDPQMYGFLMRWRRDRRHTSSSIVRNVPKTIFCNPPFIGIPIFRYIILL